uniref:Uncharacterized protein n=1 Tax=Zea mays TaxID=4577 RepID=B6UFZ4_MAIZE|nr:hypothetical protein [Zea mays]
MRGVTLASVCFWWLELSMFSCMYPFLCMGKSNRVRFGYLRDL